MQSNEKAGHPRRATGAWLKLSIHLDAFRYSPIRYIEALWWRLRGKRLRSRSRFAELFGVSNRAYELWVSWEVAEEPTNHRDATPPILALIDIRFGNTELDRTLRSLFAEGMAVLQIGTQHIPTFAEAVRQIDWSKNPWIMPIAPGDTVAPGAARIYRHAIAATQCRVIYADDDIRSPAGHRTDPHFKPDWNKELFHHFDYISAACIIRPTRLELETLAESGDWVSRLTQQIVKQENPAHVRKVLHHRETRPQPTVPEVLIRPDCDLPLVTIIVPTRNRMDLLQTCLEGITKTDYPHIEVIVVDNASDDPQTLAFLADLDPARFRVLRYGGAFNYSAINNHAAKQARGDLLCLLNNDIEIIDPLWLTTMVTQALRSDVGAVGARLLYPDGRIQHAGVVLGMGNAAGHAHRLLRPTDRGYFYRHSLPQFTSAVTAACLVLKRAHFWAVGGLDEKNFAVAFNDVDLCMRLNQRGWQSLYEPRATLVHHESVSRGFDRDPAGSARFASELAALKLRWSTNEIVDPFHHPQLSRASERFVLKLSI